LEQAERNRTRSVLPVLPVVPVALARMETKAD
jgi:hypothetical protein